MRLFSISAAGLLRTILGRGRFAVILSVGSSFFPLAPSAAAPSPARAAAPASTTSPRERISINADWRFQKDDPPGNTVGLLYDVRPQVGDPRADGPADAKPEAAVGGAAAPQAVVKPWILPAGNRFIKDPARRLVRPPGNWGGEIAYVGRDFDDRSWARVDLPHDWAIAGPFIPTGEGTPGHAASACGSGVTRSSADHRGGSCSSPPRRASSSRTTDRSSDRGKRTGRARWSDTWGTKGGRSRARPGRM